LASFPKEQRNAGLAYQPGKVVVYFGQIAIGDPSYFNKEEHFAPRADGDALGNLYEDEGPRAGRRVPPRVPAFCGLLRLSPFVSH
jgi:hypothetical protein